MTKCTHYGLRPQSHRRRLHHPHLHCLQHLLSQLLLPPFPLLPHRLPLLQLHQPSHLCHPSLVLTLDMPFMLFDPSNPLLASQLLSGTLPQISATSATSPSTPTSTMNTLKRKLEEKASASPGENDSGTGGEEPQRDKRLRTTITPEQLEILYQKYLLDSNPTRKMLDHIAHEVGLKKRVVQVWFQNTRARERKGQFRAVGPAQAHRRMAKHFGINQTSYEGPKTECTLCGIKYSARLSVRDHIFSQQHISKVKETIGSQLDKEKEYFDPATVRQLMAQQELDRIKKANEVLGLAAQQQGMFDNTPLQALNLPAAYPALQGIPPVLLPGLNSPSLPGFTPSNTGGPAFPWQTSLRTSGDPYSSCLSPGLLSLQRYPRK
uniref:Homeobox domain-containing protein n=1 Tax=Meleagris gallopavo TaxID=9103 RepID=A0A803YID2_MELGA